MAVEQTPSRGSSAACGETLTVRQHPLGQLAQQPQRLLGEGDLQLDPHSRRRRPRAATGAGRSPWSRGSARAPRRRHAAVAQVGDRLQVALERALLEHREDIARRDLGVGGVGERFGQHGGDGRREPHAVDGVAVGDATQPLGRLVAVDAGARAGAQQRRHLAGRCVVPDDRHAHAAAGLGAERLDAPGGAAHRSVDEDDGRVRLARHAQPGAQQRQRDAAAQVEVFGDDPDAGAGAAQGAHARSDRTPARHLGAGGRMSYAAERAVIPPDSERCVSLSGGAPSIRSACSSTDARGRCACSASR
jgi:hypothetical protein